MSTPDLYGRTPITDDDETIARLLDDVSVPTLLCAMVHITGDPSWIRDEAIKPQGLFLNIYDGFMSPEGQTEARARALPHILAFRDSGGELPPPPQQSWQEMMAFIGCADIPDDTVPMMLSELNLATKGVPSPEALPVAGEFLSWSSDAGSRACSLAFASARPGSPSRSSTRTPAPAALNGKTRTPAPVSMWAVTSTATHSNRPTVDRVAPARRAARLLRRRDAQA